MTWLRGASVMCVDPWVSQWALMTTIACGSGSSLPTRAHSRVKSLSEIAFIGLPWPTNSTGIRSPGVRRASRSPGE
jgi:hypothetical protein